MTDYQIREIRPDDIDELVVLCREHAKYEQAPYHENRQADRLKSALFGDNPPLACLVVHDANKLVGYATYMMQFSTWDAHYYLYLDCLYLRPEARNRGLGTQIMTRIREVATARGCVNMQWQTPDFNRDAIRFYERLGATARPKARFFLTT